jgi:hypothetical protein
MAGRRAMRTLTLTLRISRLRAETVCRMHDSERMATAAKPTLGRSRASVMNHARTRDCFGSMLGEMKPKCTPLLHPSAWVAQIATARAHSAPLALQGRFALRQSSF